MGTSLRLNFENGHIREVAFNHTRVGEQIVDGKDAALSRGGKKIKALARNDTTEKEKPRRGTPL